ncbi:hypothetical protein IFM89_003887 [Coptis chinensis]|uniref:Uncharacterized protein n=1 Tax=Coptis chinensis TaxID=261450 RepID=A0A835I0U3_9MAGN|nr:hypothetical protein IFM89_003887 [Coptis chinensis]
MDLSEFEIPPAPSKENHIVDDVGEKSQVEVSQVAGGEQVLDKGEATIVEVHAPKSYTAALKPKYGRNIDTSSSPIPGKQGEFPTISLIEEEVDNGIKHCSQSLVGRLDMSKIDLERIKILVQQLWRPVGKI